MKKIMVRLMGREIRYLHNIARSRQVMVLLRIVIVIHSTLI